VINKIPADIAAIADQAAQLADVDAVYLFGSFAAGSPHKDSDIDIGILSSESSMTERDIYRRLPRQTSTGRQIDYRILNSSKSPAFLSRAVIKGIPLKVNDETRRAGFESLALRMWNDWQFKLKIQEDYQRRFLLSKQPKS